MREALIILGVIAVLFALSAFRYRKQLRAAYGVWKAVKEIRAGRFPDQPLGKVEEQAGGKLARCMTCGNWRPESKMRKVGNGPMFCSSACFEQAAKRPA